MAYEIRCGRCRHTAIAREIVDLIDNFTNPSGMLKCAGCGAIDASIHQLSQLQEGDRVWERHVRGVVRLVTAFPTYSPYVFLFSDSAKGQVDAFQVNYYKDTRPSGKLKHGHGPGGTPVLRKSEFLQLLQKLIAAGALTVEEVSTATQLGPGAS